MAGIFGNDFEDRLKETQMLEAVDVESHFRIVPRHVISIIDEDLEYSIDILCKDIMIDCVGDIFDFTISWINLTTIEGSIELTFEEMGQIFYISLNDIKNELTEELPFMVG